jgi:Polysaccharide pyruvyl transferase
MTTKPSQIRLLSYHHIPNNGAFLFAYSLLELLQKEFPSSVVRTMDYRSRRLAAYEYLKRFKLFRDIPLFYAKRARMWEEEVEKHLRLDKDFPHFVSTSTLQRFFADQYSAMVVGMDVWCVVSGTERPAYPNIYWLPEKSNITKIAYGVSAYHSDMQLVQKAAGKLAEHLDEFDVIGARDRFTFDLVQKYRRRQDGLVDLIPDPAFTYELRNAGAAEKLESMGVDFSRPTLGLLFHGDDRLSGEIHAYYKAKGYQILAMGMYNPVADFNLGHLLTPFEWAETFRLLNFCISDRFHGTIFCLKNNTPFICLEKERFLPREQSKIFDLLRSFDLEVCYQNPADDDFETVRFLSLADELEDAWQDSFASCIPSKINDKKQAHKDFIQNMKGTLRDKNLVF